MVIYHGLGYLHCSFVMLFTLLLIDDVTAEKESDYYPVGRNNQNTKRKMYWKDSVNILQDLDQFDALYIQYHGCVWSQYGSRYGNGRNYDEQGAVQSDYNDDESNESIPYEQGCGAWGGEYFWYMGRTQCFKANVSYSLYGVLKGESVKEGGECSKATYINSFFTTFGVDSFAAPFGLRNERANSQCTTAKDEDGEEEDFSAYRSDDDYLQWDDNFDFQKWEVYTSYGMGCSAHGTFVLDQYQGAFCHGQNYMKTLDTLDSFNEAMEKMQCVLIYDGDSDGDYQLQDFKDDDASAFEFEEMSTVEILTFSSACSIRQYRRDCPDPYGLKRIYDRTTNMSRGYQRIGKTTISLLTYLFYTAGLLCWLASYRLLHNAKKMRNDAKLGRAKDIDRTWTQQLRGLFRETSKKESKVVSAMLDNSDCDNVSHVFMGKTKCNNEDDDTDIDEYGFEYVRTPSSKSPKASKRTRSRKSRNSKKKASINPPSIVVLNEHGSIAHNNCRKESAQVPAVKADYALSRTLSISRFFVKKHDIAMPRLEVKNDLDTSDPD